MPRFTLAPREQLFVGQALAAKAREMQLNEMDALYRAAATTQPELKALVQAYLLDQKAQRQTRFNAIDAEAAATKTLLTTEMAEIDSALSKL